MSSGRMLSSAARILILDPQSHPLSSILYPLSSILNPPSSILDPPSAILDPVPLLLISNRKTCMLLLEINRRRNS